MVDTPLGRRGCRRDSEHVDGTVEFDGVLRGEDQDFEWVEEGLLGGVGEGRKSSVR